MLEQLNRYRESYHDKWADELQEFEDMTAALYFFCKEIRLPNPEIQGGLT